METQEKRSLAEMLSILNAKTITEFSDFEPLFDVQNLVDGQPQIITERPACIIFDNRKFNNTYVIDLFMLPATALAEKIKEIDFFYCDSVKIRTLLFAPQMRFVNEDLIDEHLCDKIERELIEPAIMFIVPKENIIAVHRETTLLTINQQSVSQIIEVLLGERPMVLPTEPTA